MAGRWTGYIQAALALAGVTIQMAFVTWLLIHLWKTREMPLDLVSRLWIAGVGFGLFGTAWIWGLITGLIVVSEARSSDSGKPPSVSDDLTTKF